MFERIQLIAIAMCFFAVGITTVRLTHRWGSFGRWLTIREFWWGCIYLLALAGTWHDIPDQVDHLRRTISLVIVFMLFVHLRRIRREELL